MIYLLLTVIFQVFIIRRRGKIRFPEGVHSPCEYYELLQELIQDITKYYQTTKFQTDSLNFTQVIVGQRNVKISTICVRVSTYYFFVRRPQNEFPRPIWKSRNPKCITLLYIGYFAASIRAAKSHFCPPAGKRQLPGRCAKRSCRLPAPSSRKKSILTLASKKESLRSHVCQPRLRLGRQLHVIRDISYFTDHGS